MSANFTDPTTAMIAVRWLDLLHAALDLGAHDRDDDDFVRRLVSAPEFVEQRIGAAAILVDIATALVVFNRDRAGLIEDLGRWVDQFRGSAASFPEIPIVFHGLLAWRDCLLANDRDVSSRVRLHCCADDRDPIDGLFSTLVFVAHILAGALAERSDNAAEDAFKMINSDYLSAIGSAYLDEIGA